MSHSPHAPKEPKGHEAGPNASAGLPIHLRMAVLDDVPALVPLVLRLKSLNEEFDPLLKARKHDEKVEAEILTRDIKDPDAIVLATEGVGADKDRIVGVVRARIRERPFYTPEREGVILDIYLLPLYRRHGVGEYLLEEITKLAKEKGAGVLTAEFPLQNHIAASFYNKRGFRPTTGLYSRPL